MWFQVVVDRRADAAAVNAMASGLSTNPSSASRFQRASNGAAVDDVVRYALASALPTRLAGIARHEAQLFHLRGPPFVVVAVAAGFAEMELPQVRHLVHERRDDLAVGAADECRRVERDLVDDAGELAMTKPPVGEMAK
jgi:hypothetical protein